MTRAWKPRNWEEVCKRNAGRRKLHMRLRKKRAQRILLILTIMEAAPELREAAHHSVSMMSETMQVSKATASRDSSLARRIHVEFFSMFGRTFKSSEDQIVWSWDWSYYGFVTAESLLSGHRKAVGEFPFDTRKTQIVDEAYCGFTPSSWGKQRAIRIVKTYSGPEDLISFFEELKGTPQGN